MSDELPEVELPEVADPPRYYRLVVPRGARKWITANGRLHHMARARLTRQWRQAAGWQAHTDLGEVATIHRARVAYELRFRINRERDPDNWAPTSKAVMDGLVDMRLFPDDSYQYVEPLGHHVGPKQESECLIVHIWPVDKW